jgi:ferritin
MDKFTIKKMDKLDFGAIKDLTDQHQEVPMGMNGIVKPNCLPEEVQETLNSRIGDEYIAYYFYRNAANWCNEKNYNKAGAFFDKEAEGELEHGKGLQEYLVQWNTIPAIPGVATKQEFASLVDIINKAYELEYNLLMKYSEDQKNFHSVHPATYNFIQKYVDIQNGEVAEYADLLNALELIDINSKLDVLFFEKNYF